ERGEFGMNEIAEAFHREHQRTYGHFSRADSLELINLRASGTLRSQSERKYDAKSASLGGRGRREAEPTVRGAYFGKALGLIDTSVVPRSALSRSPTPGPLIVEEYDATCVVPPGATVAVDSNENIEIRIGVRS